MTSTPSSAPSHLSVRALDDAGDVPRVKPAPEAGKLPLEFAYSPSDDGTDENLLILLHGLGDTHMPFARLGRQLKLPQTATLAIRAPEQIPYLHEDAFQWYESFDQLGELLTHPNPTAGIDSVLKVLRHLTTQCSWAPNRIHLFGFAQGGSVAVEVALRWWKESAQDSSDRTSLASVASVSGPLLSHPSAQSAPCPTKVLIFHRSAAGLAAGSISSLKRGFGSVKEVKVAGGDGMPRSQDEWRPVMEFWSEVLHRRRGGGLYEVLSTGL